MNLINKIAKIVLMMIFILCIFTGYTRAAIPGKVIADNIRLRKEANTDSKILILISINEKVEVIEKEGEWYKISYKEHTGYTKKEFIKLEEDWYRVVGVQDIDAYARRDQVRPARDARVGMLPPKLAQILINLCGELNDGARILDPFCGTGGILIEAGLIGCKVVGSDVNWKMKNGTAINLDYCGITDYRTFHLDVRELKMYEKVAGVVTDPPYGISTSTGDIDGDDIFKEFFHAIYHNMADDAYLCMASPHYVDLNPMIDDVGFELVEQYSIKMHRSLTRIISVIKKS